MEEPKYPVITYDEKHETIGVYDSDERPLAEVSASLLINNSPFEEFLFDSVGYKWKCFYAPNDKIDFWFRLKAYTYNPMVLVNYRWQCLGEYKIEELKTAVIKAVEADDDVLTQFAEADTIIRDVKAAGSFNDVHIVLEKYIFGATGEEDFEEEGDN